MQTTDPDRLQRLRDWRSDPENMLELIRPRRPEDTVHKRGGKVGSTPRYCKGGKVLTSRVFRA